MSKLTRYSPWITPIDSINAVYDALSADPNGQLVLYTDAKARHEQLLAALNRLITAVDTRCGVVDALNNAIAHAEMLKEI